jgi:nucleoside-diphosphate-sugar epimerase
MTKKIDKYILITGITGFLGSSLAKFLLLKGYYVIGLKRSSLVNKNIIDNNKLIIFNSDRASLEHIFSEYHIDIIINTATSSHNRGGDLSQIMDANVAFPLKLLKQAYIDNNCKFINAGTLIPNKYVDSYFLSKKIFISCMKEYSKHIKIVDMRLQMLYGKHSSPTQFVSKIALDLLKEKECLNLTKGDQERDLVYIDDAVSAFYAVINNINDFKDQYTEVDLGSGVSISIKNVVKKLKKITSNQTTCLNFGSIEYRDNEIMSVKSDNEFLRSLGWEPRTSLDKGLKLTVDGLS